jgi:single-strand DNA-binding protein
MNTTTITGRLTSQPQAKATRKGTAVCELRIAVDDQGDTSFVPVTCYGRLAETAGRYLAKGRLVGITGRLVHDEWRSPESERRSRLYVTARSIDFLDSPSGADGQDSVDVGEQDF